MPPTIDIELVHEIVTLAESLFPTLPERDRLPTNALFIAAEEILPRYGLDPENTPSHIARLIFKIGGQRSGNTLGDKFRSVLGGLGIQLEFVPSSPSARPGSSASTVPSYAPSTRALSDPTETLEIAPGIGGNQQYDLRHFGEADDIGPEVPSAEERVPLQVLPDLAAGSRLGSEPELGSSFGAGDHDEPIHAGPGSFAVGDVDVELLEEKLEYLREQEERRFTENILANWHENAYHAKHVNDQLMAIAVEYDNEDLMGEVLDIWEEEAAAAEELRAKAEAAAKHEAYVAKMEKRASRVHEIFTICTVLAQWQEQAHEEIERTAVARRHLVRKRAFEGWHAQHVEDETKVRNFILGNALQKWCQVALHHEVRYEVATQWHQQQLCNQVIDTMREECKERTADEFYAVGLANQSLDTWAGKARNLQDEYQVAVALDERLVLDEAVNIWLEEVDAQQYHAYECTRQWLVQGCRKDLEYWQEQARLLSLLKEHNARQDHDTKCQALGIWGRALQDAKSEAALADAFLTQEPVDHWEREMKLKLWTDRDAYETKLDVLEHWALEEKLSWYKGHLEKQTKRQTLNTLFNAARQARGERERHEEEADYIDTYHTQSDVLDAWADGADQMWKHQQNADLVNLYRSTKPCLDHWREQSQQSQARSTFSRRKADKHRARSIVSGVLEGWPDIAEGARRERLMTSLRQFRRKYKVELAEECLGKWLDATADALDAQHDARQTNLHYKREDLDDCLDLWNRAAKKAESIQRVAADAEAEVYCGKWQTQLHEVQENMQDAVEYDAEQSRKRCWEKWEFQTLQNGGKRHLAQTLQEKNERRVRRKLLDEWQIKAVPEATTRDNNSRLNTLSARRSVRQQLSRSSIGPGGPGFYTASQLATLPTPRRELGSATPAPLGPMLEFDEDQDPLIPDPQDPGFMSTPTRWTGSTRTLAHRPIGMSTSTPSAILPSPYERELRRRIYGGGAMSGLRPRGPVVEFADINEESAEDLYE